LSFIFVIVCGLFEWKQIYTGFIFVCLYTYSVGDPVIKRGGDGCDHFNQFNTATCLCLFPARTWISNVICRGLIRTVTL